jgi:hypothetical protein
MATKLTDPYVVVDDNRNTGIFLLRGRKFVHLIMRDPHFKLQRVETREFDTEWRPLHYYSNGAPGETPYDVQTAARRYLEYSRNAGATETALRYLTDIAEGKYDMSSVESAPSDKQDAVITNIPKMEKLDTALAKAAKSTSTKGGTTAAAKRPSKAKVVSPPNGAGASAGASPGSNGSSTSSDKEKDMQARTHTAASKSKTPAAVVMKGAKGKKTPPKPAAKKTPAKPATKKADGAPAAPRMDTSLKIQIVAEDNPRREGSQGYDNWKIIKRYDGKTVEAYLNAGGGSNHLRWDVQHGSVKLVK